MWAKIKTWFYELIGRKSKEDKVFGLEVFNEKGVKTFSAGHNTALLASVEAISLRLNAGQSVTYDFSHKGSKAVILTVGGDVGGRGAEVYINGAKVTFKQVFGSTSTQATTINIGILL